MTARFRLVQYTPDPFAGSTLTVGALVETVKGVRWVRAPLIPGPSCVGGHSAWTSMQMLLDTLAGCRDFEVRSGEFSALSGMTEPRAVPSGVADPVAWVEACVLPRAGVEERDSKDVAHRQPREAIGFRFFEQWGVSKYVGRRFRTDHLGVSLRSDLPQTKNPISYYVAGASEVLLMEPVIGTRPKLTDDLRSISESFLAFERLFEISRAQTTPTFVVYVLPSGYADAMAEAHEILRGGSSQIINVDDPAQRKPFLARIQAVGRSGEPQGSLGFH